MASHMLYESVADKINYLAFFNDFNMPNTFNSWFLVTELHVWMLLLRSMAEGSESGEDGRFLRNCIVETLWGDVNTRAKKLGVSNNTLLNFRPVYDGITKVQPKDVFLHRKPKTLDITDSI